MTPELIGTRQSEPVAKLRPDYRRTDGVATSVPTLAERYVNADGGNGESFRDFYANLLRYDHSRKGWFYFDGQHWCLDSDGRIREYANDLLKQRLIEAVSVHGDNTIKWLVNSRNEQRIQGMLKAAAGLEPIRTDGDLWNSDPMLLGVANGVIDLRTGELRDGEFEDFITKISPITFNPQGTCPRWERFLREVFCDDEKLISFVQRAVGYSLTGRVTEQCFFYLHGSGANGKSTLVEMLLRLLGPDLGWTVSIATLLSQKHRGIPSDIAALEGHRLVTGSEPPQGVAWSDDRLKLLTGSEHVTARRLYANERTFMPIFKLWLCANHFVATEDQSLGFWRRVRVIPFNARFEGTAQDKNLSKTLNEELPGILAWAVRGCLEWQDHGLRSCKAVDAATEEYRAECDGYFPFIDGEITFADPTCVTTSARIREVYEQWHKDHPGAPQFGDSFWKRLKEQGARKADTRKVRGWQGVAIVRDLFDEWYATHPDNIDEEERAYWDWMWQQTGTE